MIIEKISGLARRHPVLRRTFAPVQSLRRRWLQKRHVGANHMLARLAEAFAEDPVLYVAEFDGKFAVSARSHLFRRIVESGEYEPVLTCMCLELLDPKRDVIDVGANIGLHTILLARQLAQRRLLAVEPTRNALARLKRNITLNGVDSSVTVFEGVASDAPGWLDIKTIDGLEEYSSLGVIGHPSVAGAQFVTQRVEARTLDQLAAEHGLDCGFMKVDTEGMEHAVFKGARGMLARQRPVVLSELSDVLLRKNGSSALEVVQSFEALDYVVTDPLHPGEAPGSRDFGDIICIPKEHPRARRT
jgi:FkbM family methyltransferase